MNHSTQLIINILCIFFSTQIVFANTLEVGNGFAYATIQAAANDALPGDTVLVHEGIYSGGNFLIEVQGTSENWIYILEAPGENAIVQGSTEALHITDAHYVYVSGLTFEQQTGNGVNTDDGGTYETPTHHIIYDGCTFQNMASSGNNDLLKMSGVDTFAVRNCLFLNGSNGGSGIDMVGCHYGVIENNHFENMGNNSIQAKGGTQHIRIQHNFFKNGGLRAVNLGGSTGLAFFRPDTAHFEAADLQVYANVIVGSWAAVAYVGCTGVEVVNNTIYQPENWVIRILQETVDPDRFVSCSFNTFRNNIVYRGNGLSTDVNIGPNTLPETFTFSNNLWYNFENLGWGGPNLPVTDVNNIVGSDPLFVNAGAENFRLQAASPALGTGFQVVHSTQDFDHNFYHALPSIGAFEANPAVLVKVNMLLEGAYEVANGGMNTILKNNDLLPLAQPFNRLPWDYMGGEQFSDFHTMPYFSTDWVLLEVRDAADVDLVVAQQAAILWKDGRVQSARDRSVPDLGDLTNPTALENDWGVVFDELTAGESYRLIVRSRNHLAALGSQSVALPNATAYDFTDPSYVAGTEQLAALGDGRFGCIAGDFNSDGVITVADFNQYQNAASSLNGYYDEDVNMDRNVTVSDFNQYQVNASVIGVCEVRY